MSAPVLVAIGVLAAGAGAGAFALLRKRPTDAKTLSERRRFVLETISQVVPSQYGDSKFARIAPGYNPDDPNLPRNKEGKLIYTTCGEFPCFIGRELGAPKCISQGGLNKMRDNGRAQSAWVDATGKNLPRPGDLYGIGSDALIVHVGAVIEATDNQWVTADAGQGAVGPGQRADRVVRPYDAATNTLGGPGAVFIAGKGWSVRGNPRTVAGWIDIDKVAGAKP